MIAHVILFAPRSDLTNAQRLEILEAFTAAARAAPGVRSVRAGRRVRHGLPGYESAMRENFEYLAILEFDDLAGLKAYLQHPAHAAAGQHFTESGGAALAYDYAVVSPDDVGALIGEGEDAGGRAAMSEESKKD
jgi:hypothetical protein